MTVQNNSLSEIAEAILQRDYFTLVGHLIPDGDCIGSLTALCMVLEAAGKTCNILLQDSIPPNYYFLSAAEKIQNLDEIEKIHENIIFLDCADQPRCGSKTLHRIQKSAKFVINIDHHGTNEGFGNLNYIDASAAATAEILVPLIHALKQPISPAIAKSLYTAIVMDTGNFQFSSTTSQTLKIAAELLECGADLNQVRVSMFESKDKRDIQMIAITLSHMQLSEDRKLAWMYMTLDEARAIDGEDFHPEGLVNFLRSMKGVEVAVYFRQTGENFVRVAFRSKYAVDVSQLAAHFGGGGHAQAAGASFTGTLQDAMATVIPYVREMLDTL